jgi:hypothetical protein
MSLRTLVVAATVTLGVIAYAGSAYAFSEEEIIRLHEACVHGDRDACGHRDAAIHDPAHEVEWRRSHPEWYR